MRAMTLKICGGNPGCIRVIVQMLATENGIARVGKLFDLEYRGPFIWLIYKDLLGGDLVRFGSLLDDNKLADEIERRIQDDERFARTWRYHEEHYTHDETYGDRTR